MANTYTLFSDTLKFVGTGETPARAKWQIQLDTGPGMCSSANVSSAVSAIGWNGEKIIRVFRSFMQNGSVDVVIIESDCNWPMVIMQMRSMTNDAKFARDVNETFRDLLRDPAECNTKNYQPNEDHMGQIKLRVLEMMEECSHQGVDSLDIAVGVMRAVRADLVASLTPGSTPFKNALALAEAALYTDD